MTTADGQAGDKPGGGFKAQRGVNGAWCVARSGCPAGARAVRGLEIIILAAGSSMLWVPGALASTGSSAGVGAVSATDRGVNGKVVHGVKLVKLTHGSTQHAQPVEKLNPVAFQLLGYGPPPTGNGKSSTSGISPNPVVRRLLQE